jgi:glycosyltransferase involved in cell wall biosynthesis
MSDVFCFFRQTPLRLSLLQGKLDDAGAGYLLYGMNHIHQRGVSVAHNLSRELAIIPHQGRLAQWLGHVLTRCGGLSGDFQTLFTHRREANRCRVILSTVDTVGIPLVLLNYCGLIARPLIYVSIGLPERIARLRNPVLKCLYRAQYRRIKQFVAYGWEEALWLRKWLTMPPDDPRVAFIPFGVNESYFTPFQTDSPDVDVLSVGADPQRDFASLLSLAARHRSISFRLIVDKDRAAGLGSVPTNTEVLVNVPFPEIRTHLATARVIALPVHENTYSAGTTTLLQAMAMARPVVVSQTGAIRNGYHLEDKHNCRLVRPGDDTGFEAALMETLSRPDLAFKMGHAARHTIVQHHTWSRFESDLESVIRRSMT